MTSCWKINFKFFILILIPLALFTFLINTGILELYNQNILIKEMAIITIYLYITYVKSVICVRFYYIIKNTLYFIKKLRHTFKVNNFHIFNIMISYYSINLLLIFFSLFYITHIIYKITLIDNDLAELYNIYSNLFTVLILILYIDYVYYNKVDINNILKYNKYITMISILLILSPIWYSWLINLLINNGFFTTIYCSDGKDANPNLKDKETININNNTNINVVVGSNNSNNNNITEADKKSSQLTRTNQKTTIPSTVAEREVKQLSKLKLHDNIHEQRNIVRTNTTTSLSHSPVKTNIPIKNIDILNNYNLKKSELNRNNWTNWLFSNRNNSLHSFMIKERLEKFGIFENSFIIQQTNNFNDSISLYKKDYNNNIDYINNNMKVIWNKNINLNINIWDNYIFEKKDVLNLGEWFISQSFWEIYDVIQLDYLNNNNRNLFNKRIDFLLRAANNPLINLNKSDGGLSFYNIIITGAKNINLTLNFLEMESDRDSFDYWLFFKK